MSARLAAVSVDLDEVPCYCAIHGLRPPDASAATAIYDRALPRLERLFADEGVPATFFVIGSDLERPEARAAVARLRRAGHEIGNHSHRHLYDLTRRDAATVAAEIRDAADAIEGACGARPTGFRAPGYTVTDGVLSELAAQGYAYDSSVFPCPAYYAAKTAAIALIAARGRRSHSVVDDPRVLTAPTEPYRIGRPYWRRGQGLVELPIGVTRLLGGRLPYIGTSVVLSGEAGATWLTRAMAGRRLVNLELHGIDLADAARDGLSWLAPHQPDLRRSAADKERALRAALKQLGRQGYTFTTLADAGRRLAPP